MISALSSSCGVAEDANYLPAPQYPPALVDKFEHGEVVLLVRFANDGTVRSCEVEKATASKEMQDYTVDFIRKTWRAPKFKGLEEVVPIEYSLPGRIVTAVPQSYQRPDRVPRNLGYDVQSGVVLTHCSFDANGRVAAAIVVESSGNPQADAYAIAWLKTRYHNPAAANLEADVPMRYRHWEKTDRSGP